MSHLLSLLLKPMQAYEMFIFIRPCYLISQQGTHCWHSHCSKLAPWYNIYKISFPSSGSTTLPPTPRSAQREGPSYLQITFISYIPGCVFQHFLRQIRVVNTYMHVHIPAHRPAIRNKNQVLNTDQTLQAVRLRNDQDICTIPQSPTCSNNLIGYFMAHFALLWLPLDATNDLLQ